MPYRLDNLVVRVWIDWVRRFAEGRQLGVRLAVPSGADNAAGSLPGDPATLGVGLHPGGGMGDALDRVVVVGDDGPFVADAKVDAAAGLGLAGGLGLLADDGPHRDESVAAAAPSGP